MIPPPQQQGTPAAAAGQVAGRPAVPSAPPRVRCDTAEPAGGGDRRCRHPLPQPAGHHAQGPAGPQTSQGMAGMRGPASPYTYSELCVAAQQRARKHRRAAADSGRLIEGVRLRSRIGMIRIKSSYPLNVHADSVPSVQTSEHYHTRLHRQRIKLPCSICCVVTVLPACRHEKSFWLPGLPALRTGRARLLAVAPGRAGSGIRRGPHAGTAQVMPAPPAAWHRAGWRSSGRPAPAGQDSIPYVNRRLARGARDAGGQHRGRPARAVTCAGTNALEWPLHPCRRYNLMVCAQD